ncbi:hypothetical protein [Reticulibacter mediterranei]|nr:hypothetical protein [Reticulibacter mediterranei]
MEERSVQLAAINPAHLASPKGSSPAKTRWGTAAATRSHTLTQ